jgi:hypothetical protein
VSIQCSDGLHGGGEIRPHSQPVISAHATKKHERPTSGKGWPPNACRSKSSVVTRSRKPRNARGSAPCVTTVSRNLTLSVVTSCLELARSGFLQG